MRIADTRAAGKVLYLRKGTMMVVVMMTMTLTMMLTMMTILGVFTFDASFCSEDAEIKTSLTDRLTHTLTRSLIELPWTAENVICFCDIV